jgi:hypothetical protein
MELTDSTFRTSILLSTMYCTFDMIYVTFYPLSIIFGKDEIPAQNWFRTFLMVVINISYVLGVAILYIWFSWQCEEAVEEVIFLFGVQAEKSNIDTMQAAKTKDALLILELQVNRKDIFEEVLSLLQR